MTKQQTCNIRMSHSLSNIHGLYGWSCNLTGVISIYSLNPSKLPGCFFYKWPEYEASCIWALILAPSWHKWHAQDADPQSLLKRYCKIANLYFTSANCIAIVSKRFSKCIFLPHAVLSRASAHGCLQLKHQKLRAGGCTEEALEWFNYPCVAPHPEWEDSCQGVLNWPACIVASPVLCPCQPEESCIMLESGPTCSLYAKLLEH